MQYAHPGRSGLQVSRLGLGTMAFGGLADEETSGTIMDAALDAGANFFDTADVYGRGRSEEIIDIDLDQLARRDKASLCVKRCSTERSPASSRSSSAPRRAALSRNPSGRLAQLLISEDHHV